ncbi:SAM-dependent methyltransferase [Desulfopila sp. IMCC35008]|uniref:SAM-dependent methyltransferase n=1 Tax=Desulfopila sp. IMCC35008 TaxID=2653858 RepID=UPI0013D42004|nr:SAM-dependent methyltransferase [Desulfopila sp. IMCC35008]
MENQTASRSAAIIAAHRAFDSSKNIGERICYDPFARHFLPPGFTVIGKTEMPEETALEVFKNIVPGFHEYFLARTRYIDEYLQESIKSGLQQLVILGAGYDSRAYRFDELKSSVKIFEVDHPATQKVKKNKLFKIFQALPDHVTYVPVDFKKDNLQSCLPNNGYDNSLKTVFIWEGVTMYIDQATVNETLLFVSKNKGQGSSIIFDHTYREVVDGTHESKEAKGWLKIAEKSNEPLLFGLHNDTIERFLLSSGFCNIVRITSEFFNDNYYVGINRDRRATAILSIAHAEIAS